MTTRAIGILTGIIIMTCFFPAGARAGDGKTYDFEFKEMDIKKAIASIAKLEEKNVMFSRGVESRAIDVSLVDVAAPTALRLILENYGYISVDEGNVIHVMLPSERAPASNQTRVVQLHHVLASDIETNVRGLVGKDGTVTVNEQRNAFVVNAGDDTVRRIRELVEELDQENSQVYIEAKIIETSTNFSRQFGLQWGPNLNDRTANGVSLNTAGRDTALVASIHNLAGLQAMIQAGEQTGKLKVLSSPKISTLNGVAANIDSTTTYSIRTLSPIVGGAAGTSPSISGGSFGGTGMTGISGSTGLSGTSGLGTAGIQQVKAGINLQVTPFIVSDEAVRLQLTLSKSDPDFAQGIDGIPGISSNSANTSLIVRSGETAGIGGLIYHSISNNKHGVPFLSKIPLVGGLFSNDDDEDKDREIVLFLTPTIYRAGARREPTSTGRRHSMIVPPTSTNVVLPPNDRKEDTAALEPIR